MKSKEVMWALASLYNSPFRFRKHFVVVPNVSWGLLPWEADMLVVSKAGYLTEIEIKVSMQDWKKDAEKYKHKPNSGRHWIKSFYYAAPLELARKYETEGLWLKEGAGILGISDNRVEIIKDAVADKDAQKLSDAEMLQIARLGTMRYWSQLRKEFQ